MTKNDFKAMYEQGMSIEELYDVMWKNRLQRPETTPKPTAPKTHTADAIMEYGTRLKAWENENTNSREKEKEVREHNQNLAQDFEAFAQEWSGYSTLSEQQKTLIKSFIGNNMYGRERPHDHYQMKETIDFIKDFNSNNNQNANNINKRR